MNTPRTITLRHKGRVQGPINRLVSPGDIGEQIKPFIFLDYINAKQGPGFGFHPHSGIATLTYPMTFDAEHETSTGKIDMVKQGGVEWMMAGGGIWHRSSVLTTERVQGFQLWFALPPSHEVGASSAQFIDPSDVPNLGAARLLLGKYDGKASLINAPMDANLLIVRLKAGETWLYQPPENHTVGWAFAQSGQLSVNQHSIENELVVFAENTDALEFTAVSDSTFLLGSAVKYPHDLVLGNYSVHTSEQALQTGEANIREIGALLKGR